MLFAVGSALAASFIRDLSVEAIAVETVQFAVAGWIGFVLVLVIGPLAAFVLKLVDGFTSSRTRPGFEMLVENFTAGILGGAGAATRSRRTTVLHTGLYVLGLALVYALLGLIAGLTGTHTLYRVV